MCWLQIDLHFRIWLPGKLHTPNSGCPSALLFCQIWARFKSLGNWRGEKHFDHDIFLWPLISVSQASPKCNGTERNREKKKKSLPLKNHVIVKTLKNNHINISSALETLKEKYASKRPEWEKNNKQQRNVSNVYLIYCGNIIVFSENNCHEDTRTWRPWWGRVQFSIAHMSPYRGNLHLTAFFSKIF